MKQALFFVMLTLPCVAFPQLKTKQIKYKQVKGNNHAAMPAKTAKSADDGAATPWALQLQAGTQGVGADLRYGIFKQLSLRAGASFIPVTVNNVFTFSGFQSNNSVTAKFSNAHILADFVPFKKARGLRLVGGVGYLFKADGGLEVIPTGTYNYGGLVVTPEQVGKVNVDISWKGIAPYAGLGLFKSFPNNRFNVNLDLGAYYLTTPQATVVGTGLLSGNSSQSALITSNMSDYRWMPVVQLNFNFRIK